MGTYEDDHERTKRSFLARGERQVRKQPRRAPVEVTPEQRERQDAQVRETRDRHAAMRATLRPLKREEPKRP